MRESRSSGARGAQQREYRFVAKVLARTGPDTVSVDVRNKIHRGDVVEILTRSDTDRTDEIREIRDDNNRSIPIAQPGSNVTLVLRTACQPNDLIRRVEPV